MKEDNQKKVKVVEKKEEEQFQPTVDNFPTLGSVVDNFPTLGGVPTTVPATTGSATEVSSLAERFAMANMLPMNYHAQPNSLNDFPSLQNNRPKSASNPNLVPKSVPSKNGSKSSFKSAMGTTRREEDFPELTPSKKPGKPQPTGAWVKPGDNPYHNDSKPSSKTSVKTNKTKQLKNKSISDTNNLFHKVYDDTDFPTLGAKKSQTAQGSGWKQIGKTSPAGVQQSESSDNQHSVKSSEDVQTDLHSVIDRFSPVNVLPDSTDKKANKNKNQKKKKKEKDKESVMTKQASNVISESGASLRGNASLDNIANLLLNSSEPISDSEKENKIHHNTESLSSHYVEASRRKDSPLSFSAEKFKINAPTLDEEFSIPKPKPVKMKVEDNEFPALGAPAKVRKPPPGFMSEEPKSTPPPGFSKATSDNKPVPPPGFATTSPPKVDNDLAKYNLTTSMPLSAHLVDFESFKYSQPIDFKERNHQLIGDIQAMLIDEQFKFVEFKSLSGEFRKRDIDAEAYFSGCENILGKDNLAVIFPELIALLPDIDKQHELLEIYMKKEGIKRDSKDNVINISRKSRNTKGAWTSTQSGFLTCQTCRQVLLRKDYNSHVSQHNLDADFPSLGLESGPVSSGVGYGSWVKAK